MNALTKELFPIGCTVRLTRGISRPDGEFFDVGAEFTVFDHRKDGFSLTPTKLEGFPRSLGLVNVSPESVGRVHARGGAK